MTWWVFGRQLSGKFPDKRLSPVLGVWPGVSLIRSKIVGRLGKSPAPTVMQRMRSEIAPCGLKI